MISTVLLGHDNLHWGENDRTLVQHPVYKVGAGQYRRNVEVDPCPCYSHDLDLVSDYARRCWDAFPLTNSMASLYVLSHEYTARNNGIAFEDHRWSDEKGVSYPQVKMRHPTTGSVRDVGTGPQALTICLAGKRIPPMPSMTRYLVTHEYGHLAFYRTKHLRGFSNHDTPMYEQYMTLRGCLDMVSGDKGRPYRWHERMSEVFANDFRIIVMGTEVEFWPHDVPHPHQLPADVLESLVQWFKSASELCATGAFDPTALVPDEPKP